MATYQHPLWGYELTYPDDWIQKTDRDTAGFAPLPEALTPEYEGDRSGQVLVRGEWNSTQIALEALWNQHISKLAILMGAKNVGGAPWTMGGGTGFEAEIVLPKRDQKRLWVGILSHGLTILHFLVLHAKEDREQVEPLATQIISSLHFIERAQEVSTETHGVPLPPGYTPVQPQQVIEDIDSPENWRAYEGNSSPGALQAFYFRELPNYGWEIDEFLPYPSEKTNLPFARIKLHQRKNHLTLGILPIHTREKITGNVAFQKTG
jgi:hypothetical protein